MLKSCVVAFSGLVVMAASQALAQNAVTERPSIIVVGRGEAEQAPDRFRVSARLVGQGATQVEALRALAESQSRVSESWLAMEGLSHAEVTIDSARVEPVQDASCRRDDYNEPPEGCPITGYRASVGLYLDGAPVARAGDALSLASELGARSAGLEDFSLSDNSDLRTRANTIAINDARRQAEALALASGQRVIRILRISDPASRQYGTVNAEGELEAVVVVGNRLPRPTVALVVAPPPVRVSATLTVVFEIE